MSILNCQPFLLITPEGQPTVKITGQHALFIAGISIDIEIALDIETTKNFQSQDIKIPNPIVVKGLIDSGCTYTSIDESIVNSLNLSILGFSDTHTANGSRSATVHAVSLKFPGALLIEKPIHRVQSVNLSGQPYQVLIGRDLMASWNINYNGPAGFVSICD